MAPSSFKAMITDMTTPTHILRVTCRWWPVLVLLLLHLPLTATDRWMAERARLRADRATLREQAEADIARRAADAVTAITILIDAADRARTAGQDAVIDRWITALNSLDAEAATQMRAKAASLEPEPDSSNRQDERSWQRAINQARRASLERTTTLLNRSLQAGVHDLAHGFLLEILAFDPDNAAIRRSLNQVQVEGRWLGPYHQQMARQGLWWDDELGWILAREQERYAAGEYFDLQSRQWTTEAQANAVRSQPGQEWVLRSPRIALHTTLDLRQAVREANRLEQFYAGIFAAWAAFFSTRPDDYQLILGLAEHDPLKVWIYRDRSQYQAQARRSNLPDWSAGFWSSRENASFFYGEGGTVLYHEFTHQVFHIFARGNRSPVWVTEGVAIYSETPTFVDDRMVLGCYQAARRVQAHRRAARRNNHLSIERLLNTSHQQWSDAQGDRVQQNYNAAGAIAWYLMEAEDRRFRGDFIDFVRDSYRGNTRNREVWDYLGLSRAAFLEAYQAWERGDD